MTEKDLIQEWADKVRELDGDSELLFEMANFMKKRHRELPSNIWVSVRNANHGPRIKIQRNKGDNMQAENTFSMTISDSPEVIGDIGNDLNSKDIEYFKNFVKTNKDILLSYWNGKLDTLDMASGLKF